MAEIFRAVESFDFPSSGSGLPRLFTPGDLISDDDPDYRGREHLFEPVAAAAQRSFETTSAAPGERRHRTKPARSSTADSPPADLPPADGGSA